ncbi:MAG: hypothetical protein IJQ31_16450, partial [Thermoguttaceae bacterium]|nr:hypothetical protein [Thermoguttaceae bacterium]
RERAFFRTASAICSFVTLYVSLVKVLSWRCCFLSPNQSGNNVVPEKNSQKSLLNPNKQPIAETLSGLQ